jgi:hypothetical protein
VGSAGDEVAFHADLPQGLTLLAYTAAVGTPTADSMLASWAATAEQTGDLPAGI